MSKVIFVAKGTQGRSFLMDKKENKAFAVKKYAGVFTPEEGRPFVLTDESDISFFVVIKKSRVYGVYFMEKKHPVVQDGCVVQERQNENGEGILAFKGLMTVFLQMEDACETYKMLISDTRSEECRSIMLETCGYEKTKVNLPVKNLVQSFANLSDTLFSKLEIEQKDVSS